MAINVGELQAFVKAGLQILVVGNAGTGKTQMLKKAVDNLGWKMKYFSTSTLDPYAHLIGVPVPEKETKEAHFYRPKDIDDADVVFFDELNRADSATLNAVFEIIQFHSINGEKLPKLKCVVAAINPVSDEYDTERLDLALQDRFDVFLTADVVADYSYFKEVFGDKYAKAGISMFNEYQKDYNNSLRSKKNVLGYFSPRRLEKLMHNFQKFPNPAMIGKSLPEGVVVSKQDVSNKFRIALGLDKDPAEKKISSNPVSNSSISSNIGNNIVPKQLINHVLNLDLSTLRTVEKKSSVQKVYSYLKSQHSDSLEYSTLKNQLMESLKYGKGVHALRAQYSFFLNDLSVTERKVFLRKLSAVKARDLQLLMGW